MLWEPPRPLRLDLDSADRARRCGASETVAAVIKYYLAGMEAANARALTRDACGAVTMSQIWVSEGIAEAAGRRRRGADARAGGALCWKRFWRAAPEVETAALLAVMATRGEQAPELAGFVDVMRARVTPRPADGRGARGAGGRGGHGRRRAADLQYLLGRGAGGGGGRGARWPSTAIAR